MANKRVILAKPLEGHNKTKVLHFDFREPTFDEYFQNGDPRVPMITQGVLFHQEIPDVIRKYADLLLVGGDPNIMAGAGLADTLRIKECILGFFQAAETINATSSDALPTNSSSPSTGTPAPSDA